MHEIKRQRDIFFMSESPIEVAYDEKIEKKFLNRLNTNPNR